MLLFSVLLEMFLSNWSWMLVMYWSMSLEIRMLALLPEQGMTETTLACSSVISLGSSVSSGGSIGAPAKER